MKLINTLLLLAGLFALTAVHPSAQTTAPPFITCTNGGVAYIEPTSVNGTGVPLKLHCIDPVVFTPPAQSAIGSACTNTDPAGGIKLYAFIATTNTCLPIVSLMAAGGIATGPTPDTQLHFDIATLDKNGQVVPMQDLGK